MSPYHAVVLYVLGFLAVAEVDRMMAADLARVSLGYFCLASIAFLVYATGADAGRRRASEEERHDR
jgi:hypothetical protein